jgi:DNA-binding XRE family transcriptional regulator
VEFRPRRLDVRVPKRARTLANLDSNRLHMDRLLSARQIRSLLGWSRRELSIVAGISQGTIKAIEQGKTDARLSTLGKIARTFTAHGVEFVMEGSRSGVTINTTAKDPVRQSSRKVLRTEPATKAEVPDQKTTVEQGLLWLRPFVRVKKADHA